MTASFSYNPAGQIASVGRDSTAYAWTQHYNIDRLYSVNGLNQLLTSGQLAITHDARGNLTHAGTGGGATRFWYQSDNALYGASINGGPITYMIYDPLGRLLVMNAGPAPQVQTRFDWLGGNLIAEHDANTGLLRRYVHGPGSDEPIVWYEGTGITNRRFLMRDERGSIVSVSDSAGTTLAVNRYDEYGIPASTNMGRFQYTGQAWLPEIGLYYYRARIYSPTLGRFLQPDPIGYGDGMNMYAYVGGDPVNYVDPTGMSADIVVIAGGLPGLSLGGGGGGGGGVGDGGRFFDIMPYLGDDPGGPPNEDIVVCLLNQVNIGGQCFKLAAVPKVRPAPVINNTPCSTLLHRTGTGFEVAGKGISYSGLVIAGIGALGGEPRPGILIAQTGSLMATGGQVMQDAAFDRPLDEIATRAMINAGGGRLALYTVPGPVRNALGDALYEQIVGDSFQATFQWLDPDRCDQ